MPPLAPLPSSLLAAPPSPRTAPPDAFPEEYHQTHCPPMPELGFTDPREMERVWARTGAPATKSDRCRWS